MNIDKLDSIELVREFLAGSQPILFEVASDKDSRYAFVRKTLIKYGYLSLKRQDKGVIIQFCCKITGYSRQQITRMIAQYKRTGKLVRHRVTRNGFKCKYTPHDVLLLAEVDELHEDINGAAIKKICSRAYHDYDDRRYERLAEISVSHLYNLRQSTFYQRQRRCFTKTKSKACQIGTRKKPMPEGKPGYIRIDTVHQGDLDGQKGVYHINAVDEITQWEVIVSVEKISEAYLIPALKLLLEQFPFTLINFHSDNGREYINQHVAKLLQKLHIEMTKSRARQSNDNALAESKNASIVRKQFGFAHIQQKHADRINVFNQTHLNPYINYHRPCFFPITEMNSKGKVVKKYLYDNVMTPYEKLKSLHDASQYLKSEVTFKNLGSIAKQMSDNQAAKQLKDAKKILFKHIDEQNDKCA